MNSSEVVVHEVKRDSRCQVRHFLAKRVRQTGESPHRHTHREVLPLDVAGGYVLAARLSDPPLLDRAAALCGAIALFVTLAAAGAPVNLDQDRVVNLRAERIVNRSEVQAEPIRGQLDAIGKTRLEIVNEFVGRPFVAPVYLVGNDQLAVGAKRGPRPNVAKAEFAAQIEGNVLFLRVAEVPNLVALDANGFDVADMPQVVALARAAYVIKQLEDGPLGGASDSGGCAN